MTPASTRNNGNEYRYYRCVTRDKQGKKACNSRQLPAEAIESFVIEKIRNRLSDGKLVNEISRKLVERITLQRKALTKERKTLPGQIATLSAEGKKLIDTLSTAGDSARKLIERKIEEVGNALSVVEARLAKVERELATLKDTEIETQWITEVLSQFNYVWDSMTIENRGRLVRAFVSRVDVDEPNERITVSFRNIEFDGDDSDSENAKTKTVQ